VARGGLSKSKDSTERRIGDGRISGGAVLVADDTTTQQEDPMNKPVPEPEGQEITADHTHDRISGTRR
jgi:hypothetical protein